MAILKPKYTENEIWANNPPDPSVDVMEPHDGDPVSGVDAKKELGWKYGEKPPYNFVNWNNQHKDEMFVHLNQNGIVDWDPRTGYAKHAFVNYPAFDIALPDKERKIYVALENIPEDLAGGNELPEVSLKWDVDIDMTSQNIVRESSGPADANKITMTHDDGKLHHTLMSLGILAYRGGIDITQTAPLKVNIGTPHEGPLETGDIFTITNDPTGTYDATFDPLSGQGHLGEGIIAEVTAVDPQDPQQSEVQWFRIGAGLNENYLVRDGHLPMIDQSGSSGGNGRLFLAHSDQDSVDSGDLEATSRKYVQDKFIWKTGGAQGIITGDLTIQGADLNINSGQVTFTNGGTTDIVSDAVIQIQAPNLLFNTDKVLTETFALMDVSYDMEANPTSYTDLNLTSKGYVDDRFDTLITWPKEESHDAVTDYTDPLNPIDQTVFPINGSAGNTAFDPTKVAVFVEGIKKREGAGYGFIIQDGAPTIIHNVVMTHGVDDGSWVLIQHT